MVKGQCWSESELSVEAKVTSLEVECSIIIPTVAVLLKKKIVLKVSNI